MPTHGVTITVVSFWGLLFAGAACSGKTIDNQPSPGTDAAAGSSGSIGGGAGIGGAAGIGGGARTDGSPSQGCDEFNDGPIAVGSLNLGVRAQAYVEAAAELQALATSMTFSVTSSCAGISTTLGAIDTWSALAGDDAISNSAATGACDQASAKIQAVLQSNPGAAIAVAVSGGQCLLATDLQTQCEQTCQADATCTEPSLAVRCPPDLLSGACNGTCMPGATCEGSTSTWADCQGTCAATCIGTCTGACVGTIAGGCTGSCDGKCDGVATPDAGSASCAGTCEGTCSVLAAQATCTGRCWAACNGKCSGNCTLGATANVNCGARVNCKGGCSGAYATAWCEGELNPPRCAGDAQCQASCSARSEINPMCTPPMVDVTVTGSAPAVLTLKAALETYLPTLWHISKVLGPLAVRAASKLSMTGSAVVANSSSMAGKAMACVGVAANAAVSASATVSVAVQASASVSAAASAP
jgi:hypothetical protein